MRIRISDLLFSARLLLLAFVCLRSSQLLSHAPFAPGVWSYWLPLEMATRSAENSSLVLTVLTTGAMALYSLRAKACMVALVATLPFMMLGIPYKYAEDLGYLDRPQLHAELIFCLYCFSLIVYDYT